MTIGPLEAAATAGTTSTATTGQAAGATTGSAAGASELDQLSNPDLFLQLLMAELEDQNPTSPTTPASILQQTSELSQVEAVTSMTTAVGHEQQAAASTEATSLIGKQVTAVVSGDTVSGAVTAVSLSSSGTPTLTVGGTQVPLSAVTQVSS